MSVWRIKEWKNGMRRLCYVGSKATYGCPCIDGLQPQFSGSEHSFDMLAGKAYTSTISTTSEVTQEDTGEGSITVKTTVYKTGKVSDKSVPVCRCGKDFVKRGYRFWLRDEDHSSAAVILSGFARDGRNDKVLEDRFFKTRKAASNHRDVLYHRETTKKEVSR
jgi:hypothetical protein